MQATRSWEQFFSYLTNSLEEFERVNTLKYYRWINWTKFSSDSLLQWELTLEAGSLRHCIEDALTQVKEVIG